MVFPVMDGGNGFATAGPSGLGRPFWQLWSSSTLSNLADGVVKVALPLIAVRLTASPALVAGLAFAVTLPWLLFALPAGALVDRVDRRRAMLLGNGFRTLAMVFLAATAVFTDPSIWALYLVALCLGTAETIYDTAAQAILPQLVPRQRLPRANGRLQAAELAANEFVGPPLGGLLAAAGVVIAFTAPAALWAVALGVLVLVPGRFRPVREQRGTIRGDIAEGLRFLWRSPLLRSITGMVGLFNLGTNATFAVFVVYAVGPRSPMDLTETMYGVLFAMIAAGTVLGSLIAERVERLVGRRWALSLSILGGVVLVAAPGVTANAYAIATAFFAGGFLVAWFNVITVSLRQSITPAHLLGRLTSAHRLVAWGSRPIGALLGGLLGELLGLRPVFLIASALIAASLVGMLAIDEDRIAAAERAADEPT